MILLSTPLFSHWSIPLNQIHNSIGYCVWENFCDSILLGFRFRQGKNYGSYVPVPQHCLYDKINLISRIEYLQFGLCYLTVCQWKRKKTNPRESETKTLPHIPSQFLIFFLLKRRTKKDDLTMGILGGCPLISSLRSISLSSRKWSSRPPPLANRKGMCSVALSIQNKGDKRLFVTQKPVFRIRDILRRIRICVSVHRITVPDPALFIRRFRDANKT